MLHSFEYTMTGECFICWSVKVASQKVNHYILNSSWWVVQQKTTAAIYWYGSYMPHVKIISKILLNETSSIYH